MHVRSLLLASFCFLTACEKPVEHQGFQREHARLDEVKVGVDTRDVIRQKLGSPTMEMPYPDTNGYTVWYYVSRKTQEHTFALPSVSEQTTYELKFDGQGILRSMNESGQYTNVPMNASETESSTYDSSLMRDVFGSFGQNLSKKKSS
jgi:outer membrane protein assembly factor BamE (lipoprotein component of BamABCDE complex)